MTKCVILGIIAFGSPVFALHKRSSEVIFICILLFVWIAIWEWCSHSHRMRADNGAARKGNKHTQEYKEQRWESRVVCEAKRFSEVCSGDDEALAKCCWWEAAAGFIIFHVHGVRVETNFYLYKSHNPLLLHHLRSKVVSTGPKSALCNNK